MPPFVLLTSLAVLGVATSLVRAQYPSSWPQNYTGIPAGDYSPAWQKYFEVTEPLPNVTFPVARSFAGNIRVDRLGHPNDTLFFWGFERSNGSLTVSAQESTDEPWGIWLNGGPGSSSMLGLLFENGPIRIATDYSAYANQYSWNHLADYFWLDQPVGTGFSTADSNGYIADEDQMAADFWNFVANLVKVFPSLGNRPLYLTGESYAGRYIPYITKGYFSLAQPPTKLAKIAIGDGSIGNFALYTDAPTTKFLETYPQMIGYNPDVFNYFVEQTHLCGYDLNLTYPMLEHFPTLVISDSGLDGNTALAKSSRAHFSARKRAFSVAEQTHQLDLSRREVPGGPNGTIDPYYRCSLFDEAWDYAANFTVPWNKDPSEGAVDVYDIPDALDPESLANIAVFMNDPRTVAALHAPTSKSFTSFVEYVFAGDNEDHSIEPTAFFDELATNLSAHSIPVVIYSGNDDSLVSHWGSEVVIQNTTFGGIMGFERRPQTEWFTDDGSFAGIVHQERNWTYVLVRGAGHQLPLWDPVAAYVLLREFILGSNKTGLYIHGGPTTTAQGPTATLEGPANDLLRGGDAIFTGSYTTQGSVVAPSQTIAAWNSFIATRWSSASVPSAT